MRGAPLTCTCHAVATTVIQSQTKCENDHEVEVWICDKACQIHMYYANISFNRLSETIES
jgi:hypothetical protein